MRYLRSAALLLLAAACGGDAPDADDTTEMPEEAVAAPIEPRIMAIDIGIAVDSSGQIMGAGVESFPTADTLHVAVRTQAAAAGASLGIRMMRGTMTLDSTGATVGAPDADGIARTSVAFPKAATVPAGSYKVEVFLDGASGGIREFSFRAP